MFKTEQESFWANQFGDEYLDRNDGDKYIVSNIALFAKVFSSCERINTCIEFGSNIGLNLSAIKYLLPGVKQYAVEINAKASKKLQERLPECQVFEKSILDFDNNEVDLPDMDLALIKGVLIHINPEWIQSVYEKLESVNAKYILIAEYYNPKPVSVSYRGHEDRLFKRDFCGEFMDLYPEYQLCDYGFVYHRDRHFPQDDINWFLLRRI